MKTSIPYLQLVATEINRTTTIITSYDGMNRINEYIKTVGGIQLQSEQWNFYYEPTGIDKVTSRGEFSGLRSAPGRNPRFI